MQWQQRGDGDKSHDGDDIRDHDRNLLDIDEVENDVVKCYQHSRALQLFLREFQ